MNGSALWLTLFLLGCYHGINPGMGWLFAAALGFQNRSWLAVVRAIVPLTLGHLLSVAAIVVIVTLATFRLEPHVVHVVAAVILIGYGIFRLMRARHVRWVGMRVGFWGLTLWGFLMSSAHGAGLMLLPFIIQSRTGMSDMPGMPNARGPVATGLLMIAVHTLGYVLTTAAVALVVYAKVGVRFLRTGWLNVDLVWAVALVLTGLLALFM